MDDITAKQPATKTEAKLNSEGDDKAAFEITDDAGYA